MNEKPLVEFYRDRVSELEKAGFSETEITESLDKIGQMQNLVAWVLR